MQAGVLHPTEAAGAVVVEENVGPAHGGDNEIQVAISVEIGKGRTRGAL